MKIFICAPDIYPGDAVGNHCLGIARMCSRIGVESGLYAQNFPSLHPDIRETNELASSITPDDVLLLSYSIFDPWLERLLKLPGRKICYFHGVTAPELLRESEPVTALLCEKSIEQLPKLAYFDLIIANSIHTAQTLKPYISAKITVIPPVFADMPIFGRVPEDAPDKLQRRTLLVVGRVVPHKRIEDAIELLAAIRAKGHDYTMAVVGSMPNQKYSKFLFNLARSLGVLEAIDFKGAVASEDLFDLYQNALAYLSMSQHEGFCVPVLEAMHFCVPVFVREGTAAQEVVGEAGIIISGVDMLNESRLVASILSDSSTVSLLVAKGVQKEKELLQYTSDEIWRRQLKTERE